MHSLRMIARLLEYPDTALWLARREVLSEIETLDDLPASQQQALYEFSEVLLTQDVLDAQAAYLDLFERGRTMSLLLFEHRHGESRGRGQAMVDLQEAYRQAGLQQNSRELPDYLPLYLEYLSTLPPVAAQTQLAAFATTLALLQARLQKRHNPYAVLFDCLLILSGATTHHDVALSQVRQELPDHTPAALDAAWQETQVSFDAASVCATSRQPGKAQPVHFSYAQSSVSTPNAHP